jgi:hypothetical protein
MPVTITALTIHPGRYYLGIIDTATKFGASKNLQNTLGQLGTMFGVSKPGSPSCHDPPCLLLASLDTEASVSLAHNPALEVSDGAGSAVEPPEYAQRLREMCEKKIAVGK